MKNEKERKPEKSRGIPRKVRIFMRLRGYKLKERRETEDTIDILASRLKTKEKIWMRHMVRSKLKSGRIGVRELRRMKKTLEEMNIDKPILIGRGFTYAARKEARRRHIELISTSSLPSFNIFRHELVPKHEILAEEEVEELLKAYRIKPYQMPRIKASDPAVRMIGAKPGDVIKITRESQTAGQSVAYRYVV